MKETVNTGGEKKMFYENQKYEKDTESTRDFGEAIKILDKTPKYMENILRYSIGGRIASILAF